MKKMSLLLLLFLVSCATEARYKTYLNSLIGTRKDDILEALGKPDEEYTANGKEFMTYKNNNGSSIYVDQYGYGDITPNYCNTTYVLEKGEMVDWKYRGNTCVME